MSLVLDLPVAALGHGLNIGSLLEGLVEVADVARDILVSGDGEWNDGLVSP